MPGWIDTTLDQLDQQIRQLRRELAEVEALRSQLSPPRAEPSVPNLRTKRV
jgi:hypothetical protein